MGFTHEEKFTGVFLIQSREEVAELRVAMIVAVVMAGGIIDVRALEGHCWLVKGCHC